MNFKLSGQHGFFLTLMVVWSPGKGQCTGTGQHTRGTEKAPSAQRCTGHRPHSRMPSPSRCSSFSLSTSTPRLCTLPSSRAGRCRLLNLSPHPVQQQMEIGSQGKGLSENDFMGWEGTRGQVCASPSQASGVGKRGDTQNLVSHSLTTWILLGLWDTQATTTPCLESEMRR